MKFKNRDFEEWEELRGVALEQMPPCLQGGILESR
jgi:hypothetical protein